ncbi:MAG: hypothetical protein FWB78_00745 [Treponema sp.]|nr:hypothetical protein [Treponema sp.]
MKIIAIKNITRKDVPIYYRLLYTGVAVIELFNGTDDYRIEFSIEIKPTGDKDIVVNFNDDIHYPLLPVKRELKKLIATMHSDGDLPD